MNYMAVIFRTVFFYFVVLILYRVMGKREVGQLGIVDLIVSILISQLVAISIENYDDTILMSLIPIVLLTFLQLGLAYLALKVPKTRSFLDGKPSVLIKHGRINFKEMCRQKYNLDDLLMQLRENGVRNLEEVEYAILETSGNLSLFKKNILKIPTDYPFAIIVDGKIQDDILKEINRSRDWIQNILDKKRIKVDDVFYAFYKGSKTFIIRKSELLN
ncbi:MAG: DUF421 domain-containing protein [Firmicutes bacterium]|nr:DUF421 domain-containing protein [Bacillota bacterium]